MAKAIEVLRTAAPRSCGPASRRRAGSAGPARPWACSTAIRSAGTRASSATPPIVFLYELKRDLNLYLRDWAVGAEDQDHGRHHRLQPGQRRQGAALRPGPLPRRPGHARRPVGAGISLGAGHGPAVRQGARARCLYDPAQARRRGVSRHGGRRDRGQGGLSQRPGAGGLHRRASTARRRRTFRSASPSPAAPGARPSCCGWPTPTSRPRRRAVRRPDCRRSSCWYVIGHAGVPPAHDHERAGRPRSESKP